MLVRLGLRPSLHAATRKMENLPVSLAALYDKVKRTELPLLRALVQVSSVRLQSIAAALDEAPCVPGWHVRNVDGNYLPSSQKHLLKCERSAVMPLFDSAGPGQIWIADRHFCIPRHHPTQRQQSCG